MANPKFVKSGNAYSPFTFEKGRTMPVKEPINPNQTIGKAVGGAVKVANHGTAEQLREIEIKNVSETNRNNLIGFIQDSTVNYSLNTFTFVDEDSTSHTVRLWNAKKLIFPQTKGGLFKIKLTVRDEIT